VGSWQHSEHGADVGVVGLGATPAEAFAQAGHALFALVAEERESVEERVEEAIACEAPSLEDLLVAWLDELIYRLDARHLVFARFDLEIEPPGAAWRLRARAWGETYDPSRHESTVEPKGATYTNLSVVRENGQWRAECVVDV
jgi:SHS2 domain-containing protein